MLLCCCVAVLLCCCVAVLLCCRVAAGFAFLMVIKVETLIPAFKIKVPDCVESHVSHGGLT